VYLSTRVVTVSAQCLLFAASRYIRASQWDRNAYRWTSTSPCTLHQEHWY